MSELYDLPDGWEWKKLDKLVEVNIGKTPPRSKKEYFLGDKVWLSIRDLKGDFVSTSNEYLTDEAIKNSNMKIVPKGTLLMSFKLTLGRTAFTGCDLYTNEAIASLYIKDKNVLDKFFLKYAIGVIDLEKEVDNAVKGKTLNKQKIKNLDIPLPPLSEQKRIVAKLDKLFDKIDRAITLHQQNIDQADKFMSSVLDKVFGELEEKYELVKIENFAKIKGGKRLPKGQKLIDIVTDYPYIRVADFLDNGTIDRTKIKYITKDIYIHIKNYTITSKDLYISIAGTIGKTGIIPKEFDGANLTENAVKLVYLSDSIENKYIYYATNSNRFKERIGLATKTVAQPKLAIKRLAQVEIPLPPLKTQQKTVTYLNQLSKKTEELKALQTKKLQQLKSLKASILDRAFRGEL